MDFFPHQRKYFLIFSLSFIPRFSYLSFYFKTLRTSGNPYWMQELLHRWRWTDGGMETSWYEPFYPLFLAVFRRLSGDQFFWVMMAQIGVSALGTIFLYKLCVALTRESRVGLIAVFLYSFHPYLIRQSVGIIEVPLFMTLLIVASYYYLNTEKWRAAAGCGLALGLTILTRFVIFPVVLIGMGILLFKKRFRDAAILFLVVFVTAFPMFYRNFTLTGSIVPTRSGYNLFKGNCEYSDYVIPRYSVDVLGDYAFKTLQADGIKIKDTSETEVDRLFQQKAFRFMREHPWRTIRLKALNILYLFHPRLVPFYLCEESVQLKTGSDGSPMISGASSRSLLVEAAYSVTHLFIFITAIAGIYLRRRSIFREDIFLWVIVVSLTLIYAFYWPATRLRAPMDFVFIFYSAVALKPAFDRLKR